MLKKTNCMLISPPNIQLDTANLDVKIGETTLQRIGTHETIKSVSFLGIHIDEHLTWNEHLKHINSKLSHSLFSMRQVKNMIPGINLVNLYNALIKPHLNYGIRAWGNAKQCHLKRTSILQKQAIRIAHGASFKCHSEPLFKQSANLTIKDLFSYEIMIFMKNLQDGRLPASFNGTFILNQNRFTCTYKTRQSYHYFIPKTRNKFTERLPPSNYPKVWNYIIPHVDNVVSKS